MPAPKPRPVARDAVMAIDAYVPGKSAAAGLAEVHKLSSNETPLGPSPRAIEAFRSLADHLHVYPDGSASRVREAIGRRSEEGTNNARRPAKLSELTSPSATSSAKASST